MLDIFNIPGQQDNIKIFYAAGTTDWQTWTKPRNCKFIWMMCIGGGAGGNGGFGNSPTVQGGPSGASSAITRALFPANVLPDTLYIQVGTGSIGGAGSAAIVTTQGGTGQLSYVSISPSTAAMNTVCISGTAGPQAQTAGSVATTTVAGLLSLGNFTTTIGLAGTNNTRLDVTPLVSSVLSAGGEGSQAGGAFPTGFGISSTSFSPAIPGGTSISLNGRPGYFSLKPFVSTGGSGGNGTSNATTAGAGGNGAFGSGGGGGGSSSSGSGGPGGTGGDGLVIIATF
jgi:hypothetical protein